MLGEEDCLAGIPGPGQRGIILARSKMNGLPLLRVRIGMESATIIRMDLAESLLERKILGMELKDVHIADKSNPGIEDRKILNKVRRNFDE